MADVLTVQLGERSYPIHFGATLASDVQAQVEALGASGRKVAVLTDRNVATKQAEALRSLFGGAPTLVLAPGERSKSLRTLGQVLDFLVEQGMDRR